MITFQDQVAVITGGSRGIGRAAALLFARAGADVAVSYREHREAAEAVVAEIQQLGRRGLAVEADQSRAESVARAVSEILDTFGRADILVANAGIWPEPYRRVDEMTKAEWDEAVGVNLTGHYHWCHGVIPRMIEQRRGAIVLVSSTAGQRGEAGHSHYAAAKGGIISFTKSLAIELAPYQIRVNCVAPGWVETAMARPALKKPGVLDDVLAQIPLHRLATPEDIAGPILFLVSDLARHITGEVLNVNGGSVLCG